MIVNPTYCFMVAPVDREQRSSSTDKFFEILHSGFKLRKPQNRLWNQGGDWDCPIINGTACLREKHGMQMSHA